MVTRLELGKAGPVWEKLYKAKLLRRTAEGAVVVDYESSEEIIIDLKGTQDLTLVDTATLVDLIRRLGQNGARVRIVLPRPYRDRASRSQLLLSRFGLVELMQSATAEAWRSQVTLDGVDAMPVLPPSDEYFRMRWISPSSFDQSENPLTGRHEPTSHAVKELLYTASSVIGLGRDAVRNLVETVFVELGENAVMHSGPELWGSTGVLCGRVRDRGAHGIAFEFFVADAGVGIQQTLALTYKSNAIDIHRELGWDLRSAILRYAIEGGSRRYSEEQSGRPAFRSSLDKVAKRGLARLVSTLADQEYMVLQSGGAAVSVAGGQLIPAVQRLRVTQVHLPPGTQAIVSFTPSVKPTIKQPRKHFFLARVPDEIPTILTAVDPSTGKLRANSRIADLFNRISRGAEFHSLLIDLGYGDTKAEQALDLLLALTTILPRTVPRIVLWNVRSRAEDLTNIISRTPELRSLKLQVVYGPGEIDELIPNNGSDAPRSTNRLIGEDLFDYIRIQERVNSAFLADGMQTGVDTSGFFNSRVRLPSGYVVEHFFSLPANAESSPLSNGRRWIVTARVLVRALIERSQTSPKKVKVLVFSNSAKPIAESLAGDPVFSGRVILWQPYGSPTRAELENIIDVGDLVLLLTDVLATGTLREAVADSVEEAGGAVLGTAAVVDASVGRDHVHAVDSAALGHYFAGARFASAFSAERDESSAEFFLGRFSTVPERIRRPTTNILSLVESTVEVLLEADAVQAGHFSDGSRHTTIMVDLHKVLSEVGLSRIIEIFKAEWDRFAAGDGPTAPTMIMYPIFPRNTRVFTESRAVESAEILASKIRDLFFPAATILQLDRLRETDGSRECVAPVIPGSSELTWKHVLVVDDGLSSGDTARQLIQIAAERGASSVVVFSALARAGIRDVLWWQSLHSFEGGNGDLSLRLLFPLVLPIPFYSEVTCPVTASTRSLRRAAEAEEPIRSIARDMLIRFEPLRWEPGEPLTTDAVSAVWFRLRTNIALVQEEELPVRVLERQIKSLNGQDELLGLFRLFLNEQNLLDHPAIRRTIPLLVIEKIQGALSVGSADDVIRRDAIALLRARWPRHFVSIIADRGMVLMTNWELLGDCVVHLGSLPQQFKAPDMYREALSALEDAAQALGRSSSPTPRWMGIHTWLCIEQNRRPAPRLDRSALSIAKEARRILRDSALHHDLVETLGVFSRMTNTVDELDASNFQETLMKWVGEHLPIVMRRVVPLVPPLEAPLLTAARDLVDFGGAALHFLSAVAPSPSSVDGKMRGISTCLEYLASEATSREVRRKMAATIEHLSDALLGEIFRDDSVLRALLEDVRSLRLRDVADELRTRVQLELASHRITPRVSVGGNWTHLEDHRVFCSPGLIREFIGNAAMNIARHGTGTPRRVILWVREVGSTDEISVRLVALSEGALPPDYSGPGRGTVSVRDKLAFFGGGVDSPRQYDLRSPWTSQAIVLKLW